MDNSPKAETGSRQSPVWATVSVPRHRMRPNQSQMVRRNSAPSIAVLPFISLSDDTDQSYFADGLTEDIITRLARLRWLFVASRNSSFAYKGQKVEPGQVGRDLRVRYILEGSVRRSGNRLRIISQLSETSSGIQVWADSNEVELAEFFALQDLISERVIAAIEPRLYSAEHNRFKSRSPESLDAWGFVMKAMPYVWTWGSADEISNAQMLLAKAIAIDPNYSRANSLLAWTIAAQVHLGLVESKDDLPKAIAMASQAISERSGGSLELFRRRIRPHGRPQLRNLQLPLLMRPSRLIRALRLHISSSVQHMVMVAFRTKVSTIWRSPSG